MGRWKRYEQTVLSDENIILARRAKKRRRQRAVEERSWGDLGRCRATHLAPVTYIPSPVHSSPTCLVQTINIGYAHLFALPCSLSSSLNEYEYHSYLDRPYAQSNIHRPFVLDIWPTCMVAARKIRARRIYSLWFSQKLRRALTIYDSMCPARPCIFYAMQVLRWE